MLRNAQACILLGACRACANCVSRLYDFNTSYFKLQQYLGAQPNRRNKVITTTLFRPNYKQAEWSKVLTL